MSLDEERKEKKVNSLIHLTRNLRESARSLDEVARRMRQAAEKQRRNTARMNAINKALRASLHPKERNFTYLEYLEFEHAEEFKRFKRLPAITEEEIAAVDWEDLQVRLLAG